ncbi:hypothetical protein LSH36_626g05028 [Paralvinella palmiformis]|uniref:Uncharacterized protein n=1 Tax=Paralvinella palmiformis TaxID=53620 RepID=A0AAD9J3Y2_9ANNE|nr:hypothetical protein LSH36_626g05028 [Paralvinella palmiformis]
MRRFFLGVLKTADKIQSYATVRQPKVPVAVPLTHRPTESTDVDSSAVSANWQAENASSSRRHSDPDHPERNTHSPSLPTTDGLLHARSSEQRYPGLDVRSRCRTYRWVIAYNGLRDQKSHAVDLWIYLDLLYLSVFVSSPSLVYHWLLGVHSSLGLIKERSVFVVVDVDVVLDVLRQERSRVVVVVVAVVVSSGTGCCSSGSGGCSSSSGTGCCSSGSGGCSSSSGSGGCSSSSGTGCCSSGSGGCSSSSGTGCCSSGSGGCSSSSGSGGCSSSGGNGGCSSSGTGGGCCNSGRSNSGAILSPVNSLVVYSNYSSGRSTLTSVCLECDDIGFQILRDIPDSVDWLKCTAGICLDRLDSIQECFVHSPPG